MSDSAIFFIAGVAVSIPITGFFAFYRPRKGGRLASILERRETRGAEQTRRELNEARKLAQDGGLFHTLLLGAVLQTTFVTSLGGVIAGLLFALSTIGDTYDNTMATAGQLVGIIVALIIIRIVGEALAVMRRVHDFPAYEQRIRKALDDPSA
jgi:hypothetical protein